MLEAETSESAAERYRAAMHATSAAERRDSHAAAVRLVCLRSPRTPPRLRSCHKQRAPRAPEKRRRSDEAHKCPFPSTEVLLAQGVAAFKRASRGIWFRAKMLLITSAQDGRMLTGERYTGSSQVTALRVRKQARVGGIPDRTVDNIRTSNTQTVG